MTIRTQLLGRRYWDRVQERRYRLGEGVLDAYSVMPHLEFVDYWSDVPSTRPEKLVFADLIRRGVNFYFSWFMGDFPYSHSKFERYRPDFILPDYKIVIEVAGIYWHTRPGMWEYDYTKVAFMAAAGYRVFIFTDREIEEDVVFALDSIPELVAPSIRGGMVTIGDRPIDPTAAIKARIRKFPKVVRIRYKATRSERMARVKPVQAYTPAGRRIRAVKPPVDPLLTHKMFDQEYLKVVEDYGATWLEYMESLRSWFVGHGSRQRRDPGLWAYYQKWSTWWENLP